MRRARVLYTFPRILGRPGVGTTAHFQVVGLIAAGFDVTVIAKEVERQPDGVRRIIRSMPATGPRVPHRLIGRRAGVWHDSVAAAVLLAGQFDLVHGWPGASLRTFRAARRLGCPAVREAPNTHAASARRVIADEEAAVGCADSASAMLRTDAVAREIAEYAVATTVLTPSPHVEATFIAQGVDPSKLRRHRYGYDPATFGPPPSADLARPFTVIFVGRGQPRKGLHLALDAWTRAGLDRTGARLRIYGAIDEPYRIALGDRLTKPGVEVLGPQRDVAAALHDADALVLPSIEEGSALVTYEAQACGAALVVSSATGAYCEHGVQGLVHAPGDVDALAGDLRRLHDDVDLLARLRAGAAAQAPKLTWAAAGEVLAGIYEEALTSRR